MRRGSIGKITIGRHGNTVSELSDRKKTALLFFAEKGEANIYKLSEECKMRYSTGHSSVKALEKEGFVRLKSEKKNEKGVTAKVYGLTTKGLYRCIYAMSTWHKKILIAEKWQSLLKPNVLEWMKFIETLNDSNIEKTINEQIGSFLSYCNDAGFFIDVVDESFFDAFLAAMIDFDETYNKVMHEIGSYPRIKERLLRNLEEDITWREEDVKKYRMMKARLEKLE